MNYNKIKIKISVLEKKGFIDHPSLLPVLLKSVIFVSTNENIEKCHNAIAGNYVMAVFTTVATLL